MKYFLIGYVTKPQGLKGDFRIKVDYKFFKIIKTLKTIKIETKVYDIEKITERESFFIVKTKQINSVEEAENLRNSEIYAELNEKEINKNFNFMNFDVVVNNKTIGKIVNVSNFGASDIFTISCGKHEIMCAVVDNLIKSTNEDEKMVEFNEEVFNEVSV